MTTLSTAGEWIQQQDFFQDLGEYGLTVRKDVTMAEWLVVMAGAFEHAKKHGEDWVKLRFQIGDLLNQGEAMFHQEHSQALGREIGFDQKTVSNWAYVAKVIPEANRSMHVDWSHYVEVANAKVPTEKQLEVLKEAKETNATVNETKAKARVMAGKKPRVTKVKKAGSAEKQAEKEHESKDRLQSNDPKEWTDADAEYYIFQIEAFLLNLEERQGVFKTWPKDEKLRWGKRCKTLSLKLRAIVRGAEGKN